MASETRDKHRWNQNSKVYTRKFPKNKNPVTPDEPIATTITNINENGTAEKDESTQNFSGNAITDINNAAQSPNLHQQQPNSPKIEVISGDASSLNRKEEAFSNDHAENESTSARPVITRIDNDKIRISFSAARLKHERRDLKRMLVGELQEVKNLIKKLKHKESQLSSYNDAGQIHSQYSTSNGLRNHGDFSVFSDVGSVGEIPEREKRTPEANHYYNSTEFLFGTDKIPSTEINKKKKTNGCKKRGGGSTIQKQIFRKCATLLTKLMKHQYGWVFNTPVDVKNMGLHDYYDIIKHPMDLGTVKARLSKNWYKSPLEFAEEIRLTFSNAMTYNIVGHDVHIMAVELSNLFEQRWVQIEAEYFSKLRLESSHDPLPTFVSPPRSESFAVYNPPIVRAPSLKKPKARDSNKREMTFEEKTKLSKCLEDLPLEKLESVIQIIKKRNSTLSQHDGEVEIDIDSFDAETLWELDRFVINYKKSLSKRKRKAEVARQKAETHQAMQVMNPVLSSAEVPKEIRADDISSSSSSDSGSSSNDSDSDSSGSESDGGK